LWIADCDESNKTERSYRKFSIFPKSLSTFPGLAALPLPPKIDIIVIELLASKHDNFRYQNCVRGADRLTLVLENMQIGVNGLRKSKSNVFGDAASR